MDHPVYIIFIHIHIFNNIAHCEDIPNRGIRTNGNIKIVWFKNQVVQ